MLVLFWPLFAHAAAWAAFLWLVFYPSTYRGVEVQAVPAGSDEAPQVTNLSASYIEANGLWAVLPILLPVVMTGLALLAVWSWCPGRWAKNVFLWVLAIFSLGFCILGILSFGVLFLPAALALVVAAVAGTFQPPSSNFAGAPAPGMEPQTESE